MKLGCERSFSGKEVPDFTGWDELSDDFYGLIGKGLSMGDPGYGSLDDWFVK